MNLMEKINENIKRGIRSWLNVSPANPYVFNINEMMDFEGNAIRNRIWYRGDSNELEQFYEQNMQININSGPARVHRGWKCARSTQVFRRLR